MVIVQYSAVWKSSICVLFTGLNAFVNHLQVCSRENRDRRWHAGGGPQRDGPGGSAGPEALAVRRLVHGCDGGQQDGGWRDSWVRIHCNCTQNTEARPPGSVPNQTGPFCTTVQFCTVVVSIVKGFSGMNTRCCICECQRFDFSVCLEPVVFTYHRAPWSVCTVSLMWSLVMEANAVTTWGRGASKPTWWSYPKGPLERMASVTSWVQTLCRSV